jgi:tripartite-type tricarboxylate transporter receptor subunit TctC
MRKVKMRKQAVLAALAGALTLASLGAAHADPVADFYKDKTVTVVSPSGTGGSIYQYALLVSNHIGRHIPGQPTVIVEARSGGGGIKAANYVDRVAPGDGTVIAELHPGSLMAPTFEKTASAAKYDPRQFQWLGSAVARSYVGAVWHTVDANALEDLRDKEIVFGGSGRGSSSYQNPTFMANITGAKIKVIPGYKSGGETNLAMERGEVQGRGNYYSGFLATNPEWIRDKKLKFLFKMGPEHPDLANVPSAKQYMKTDEQKQMLALLEAPLNVGQAFYVDDRVPTARADALRTAFTNMLADPQFQADAKQLNLEIDPRSADEVRGVISEAFKAPKDVVNKLDSIISN